MVEPRATLDGGTAATIPSLCKVSRTVALTFERAEQDEGFSLLAIR